MSPDDPKPIRCPECHEVIGHVVRYKGVRHLRINTDRLQIVTAFDAVITHDCGGELSWHAGQEALDELLEKMGV